MQNIRIVLDQTSHGGNIGAVARAMKNMDLYHLYLVNPKDYPSEDATARSSGADDILNNAQIFSSLKDAVADCQYVIGASARARELSLPTITPREFANDTLALTNINIACVFGNERIGLENRQLALCNKQLIIPTQEKFSSLNLAMAVQIVCYELYTAHQSGQKHVITAKVDSATSGEKESLIDFIEELATEVKFSNPDQPKKLSVRIRQIVSKSNFTSSEVSLMRGFLKNLKK